MLGSTAVVGKRKRGHRDPMFGYPKAVLDCIQQELPVAVELQQVLPSWKVVEQGVHVPADCRHDVTDTVVQSRTGGGACDCGAIDCWMCFATLRALM